MSVPNGWIDPPEDLVEEGEEAYRKWEESLGPLPEPEELEAAPCEPGCLNDLEPPPDPEQEPEPVWMASMGMEAAISEPPGKRGRHTTKDGRGLVARLREGM